MWVRQDSFLASALLMEDVTSKAGDDQMVDQLLEIKYGSPDGIDEDVDEFGRFYRALYSDEAIEKIARRMRRSYIAKAVASMVVGLPCLIPVMIRTSTWSLVLLAMGAVCIAFGLYQISRMSKVESYCESNANDLLDDELNQARTSFRRVFKIAFLEDRISVDFGTSSRAKTHRSREYCQISAAIETETLFFIKGVTWLCKRQLGEIEQQRIREILFEKLGDRFQVHVCEHIDDSRTDLRELTGTAHVATADC
jgi:hypothetical protein